MARGSDQAVILSLCKRLSLVPKSFSGEVEKCDLKSMCTSILQASQAGAPLLGNDEALKWISFANDFAADSGSPDGALTSLNNELVTKSVLLGGGLKLSEVDTIVFSAIHQSVIGLPKVERQKLSHVLRWMDYVQSKEDLADLFERLSIEKAQLEPPVKKVPAKVEANPGKEAKATKADSEGNNASKGPKTSDVPDSNSKKGGDSTIQQKAKGDKKVADEKKAPEKAATAKDAEVPVSLLNMQVGLIHKASKHPSADSLLVEEIDVGEGKLRQVVSGLAKYCNPDELVNRLVVLITNVKPGKLRDVVSEGLVLCASNEDHTKVEPLLPPEGAKPGERISISGHDGKPEDVLNPKKKQLDKITPHLYTDDKGVATFKGIPFMTSAGPCTSSIPKGSIK